MQELSRLTTHKTQGGAEKDIMEGTKGHNDKYIGRKDRHFRMERKEEGGRNVGIEEKKERIK